MCTGGEAMVKRSYGWMRRIPANRDEIVDIISEFDQICDRHLGLIRATKNHIELTSEQVRPVNYEIYRAGTTSHQLEKYRSRQDA